MLSRILATNPVVDASAVKEPNYFSRNYSKGPGWYGAFFGPRTPDRFRLDASVTYTYPHYPDALKRLLATSPDVFVVYAVREPIGRALSHYHYNKYYEHSDDSRDFATAIRSRADYLGASDYARWLRDIDQVARTQQVLIVPFELIRKDPVSVAREISKATSMPGDFNFDFDVSAFKNSVVSYRSRNLESLATTVRRSALYPRLRRWVGPDSVRVLREQLTRRPDLPSKESELATLTVEEHASLRSISVRANEAVRARLEEQDTARELRWVDEWLAPEL